MTRYLVTLAVVFFSISCAGPSGRAVGTPPATRPVAIEAVDGDVTEAGWIGIYASTRETRGFAGSVLALEKGLGHDIDYRLWSYSDVVNADAIAQDVRMGSCLTQGRTLYLPEASGYMQDGKPQLLATVTRYTLMEINGRKVLMRDDALRTFREENKLYDYGILIKVGDHVDLMTELSEVKHPSIKLLYSDPTKPWKDPFIYGGNAR